MDEHEEERWRTQSGDGRLASYPHTNIQQRFNTVIFIINLTACWNQVGNGGTPLSMYLRSCQRMNWGHRLAWTRIAPSSVLGGWQNKRRKKQNQSVNIPFCLLGANMTWISLFLSGCELPKTKKNKTFLTKAVCVKHSTTVTKTNHWTRILGNRKACRNAENKTLALRRQWA